MHLPDFCAQGTEGGGDRIEFYLADGGRGGGGGGVRVEEVVAAKEAEMPVLREGQREWSASFA